MELEARGVSGTRSFLVDARLCLVLAGVLKMSETPEGKDKINDEGTLSQGNESNLYEVQNIYPYRDITQTK